MEEEEGGGVNENLSEEVPQTQQAVTPAPSSGNEAAGNSGGAGAAAGGINAARTPGSAARRSGADGGFTGTPSLTPNRTPASRGVAATAGMTPNTDARPAASSLPSFGGTPRTPRSAGGVSYVLLHLLLSHAHTLRYSYVCVCVYVCDMNVSLAS